MFLSGGECDPMFPIKNQNNKFVVRSKCLHVMSSNLQYLMTVESEGPDQTHRCSGRSGPLLFMYAQKEKLTW